MREILDRYYTPEALVQKIVEQVLFLFPEIKNSKSNGKGPTILEPSAGQGVFVKALKSALPNAWVDAVELDETQRSALTACADGVFIDDFINFKREPFDVGATYGTPPEGVAPPPRKQKGYDLIIGNPPYSLAEDHVRHAVELLAPNGVLAFLLRINVRGAHKRVGFFKELPHYLDFPLVPRPSFTGSGNDMTEYAVFCWKKCGGVIMPFGWVGDGRVPYAASTLAIVWREVKGTKPWSVIKAARRLFSTSAYEELE